MSLHVIKPGLLSSFQDLGRNGYQHLGVPVSGAMDSRAHRLANLLVGNEDDHATLEITLAGPTLRFDQAACIAICGAALAPTLNGEPVPNNRPLVVRAGDTLAFGTRQTGLRAYLAVHGGFDLPMTLGSQSTFLRGGFGGLRGRGLQKDDVIGLRHPLAHGDLDALGDALWKVKIYLPTLLGQSPRRDLRAMTGAHADRFTRASCQAFFEAPWQVKAESERMGYRLQGARLMLERQEELLSEATSFGTVQVPADGQPIVLMADRQTTGGYPKIAQVCAVDLSALAQVMPGETVRFQEITLAEAQRLDGEREEAFGRLFQGVADLRDALGSNPALQE